MRSLRTVSSMICIPISKADYILANPPFNISSLAEGIVSPTTCGGGTEFRPSGNANFAWIQHFIHHLAPSNGRGGGTAGFVMANSSLSSMSGGEGEIRRKIVEDDLVDCIVSASATAFPYHRHSCLSLVPYKGQDWEELAQRWQRPSW